MEWTRSGRSRIAQRDGDSTGPRCGTQHARVVDIIECARTRAGASAGRTRRRPRAGGPSLQPWSTRIVRRRIAIGFFSRAWLLSALEAIPGATSQHFLTGPISSVTVGITLVLPGTRLRSWFLLIAAVVAGSMLAVAIEVTDPGLHDVAIPLAGVVVGFWIIAAISLTARAFRRAWFPIPARILGSWLIAIGLLYGGVSLLPKQKSAFPLPAEPMPNIIPIPRTSHPPPDLQPPQDRPGLGFPYEDPAGLQKP